MGKAQLGKVGATALLPEATLPSQTSQSHFSKGKSQRQQQTEIAPIYKAEPIPTPLPAPSTEII